MTVVARDADALEPSAARLGVATIAADVTDEIAAQRILAESARTSWCSTPAPSRGWVGWTS